MQSYFLVISKEIKMCSKIGYVNSTACGWVRKCGVGQSHTLDNGILKIHINKNGKNYQENTKKYKNILEKNDYFINYIGKGKYDTLEEMTINGIYKKQSSIIYIDDVLSYGFEMTCISIKVVRIDTKKTFKHKVYFNNTYRWVNRMEVHTAPDNWNGSSMVAFRGCVGSILPKNYYYKIVSSAITENS